MQQTITITLASACLVFGVPVAQALPYTGGADDSHSMAAMTNDVGLGGSVVTIASATNQSFSRGYAPVAISTITVTDDPSNPGIKSGVPIVLMIPSTFAMTWDAADTNATFGGTAAGKVGTVSYSGSNRHLVITVISDFVAGDTLTIRDLSFRNYLGSGSTSLELDFDNNGSADSYDTSTVTISGAFHYGGADDSYTIGPMTIDRDMKIIGTLIRLSSNARPKARLYDAAEHADLHSQAGGTVCIF